MFYRSFLLSLCLAAICPQAIALEGMAIAIQVANSHSRGLECAARVALESKYAREELGAEASTIRAEDLPDFRTTRIFSKFGRIPPGAKARFLAVHGVGMEYSSAGSYHALINALAEGDDVKPGSTRAYLRGLPHYVPLAVEAIDLPKHRSGPHLAKYWPFPHSPLLSEFNSLGPIVNWLAEYIFQMKRETPDLPVIVLGRSASARFVAEVNRRFPWLMDAMILGSPTVAGGPERDARQLQGAVDEVGDALHTLDLDAIEWFFRTTRKLRWDAPEYFNSTPTLGITGSEDTQVLREDRELLAALAQQNASFRFKDIAGAGHNFFATNGKNKKPGREAYKTFFDFVAQGVLTQPVKPLPKRASVLPWYRPAGWR